ncbi:hypothetical protein DFJ74DRAFT_720615, partial [Hyaloraphidium curvatum]
GRDADARTSQRQSDPGHSRGFAGMGAEHTMATWPERDLHGGGAPGPLRGRGERPPRCPHAGAEDGYCWDCGLSQNGAGPTALDAISAACRRPSVPAPSAPVAVPGPASAGGDAAASLPARHERGRALHDGVPVLALSLLPGRTAFRVDLPKKGGRTAAGPAHTSMPEAPVARTPSSDLEAGRAAKSLPLLAPPRNAGASIPRARPGWMDGQVGGQRPSLEALAASLDAAAERKRDRGGSIHSQNSTLNGDPPILPPPFLETDSTRTAD